MEQEKIISEEQNSQNQDVHELYYHDGDDRLSLAYGRFVKMPREIDCNIAKRILFLDLSYNRFSNLSFLTQFSELQTLVLDRNQSLDFNTLPYMQYLEVLWLNNCNLINISDWLHQLQLQCPKLKQLSMMCNPVGQTQLNGVSDHEELEYRKKVVKILPQLQYFDGVAITQAQREQSETAGNVSLTVLENAFRRKLRVFMGLNWNVQRHLIPKRKMHESMLLNNFSFGSKKQQSTAAR